MTPVMWAVYCRNIRAVEYLVKKKCDLTTRSKIDCSAIDYAVMPGNYVMSYYLFLQKCEMKDSEFYRQKAELRNMWEKYDYDKLIECLENKIHPKMVMV